jgi:hypothetical protein
MASDYLIRSQSANKAMGKKAKSVRRQQRRAANEAVAFVTSGPKETRGKYQELGVSSQKLFKVADALAAAGKAVAAKAVRSRANAKWAGTFPEVTSGGSYLGVNQAAREAARSASTSVFPRLNPGSGNVRSALIGEIKQNLRQSQIKNMQKNTRFINKPK